MLSTIRNAIKLPVPYFKYTNLCDKLNYMRTPTNFNNLRDLHGWRCENGKTIKRGMIYRGPVLHATSQEDLNFLTSLNIDTIFDLRCPSEVREKTESPVNNAKHIICPLYNEKEFKYIVVTKIGRLRCLTLRGERVGKLIDNKFDSYKIMPFSNAFNLIFDAMDRGEKFIFHCSEGKDRTGVVSAILLYIFGASEDTIMEDYLASNRFRPGKDRSIVKKLGFSKLLMDAIMYCESVHDELLIATKAEIISKYGSLDNYLYMCFNVTEERINNWKKLYLEDF